MRISELIERLQKALSQHGDMQVLVDYYNFGEITKCLNYNTKEMCLNIKPAE